MPKKKQRRVNPHRIPMAKSKFNKEAIINDVSYGNLYYGWLLVLHSMLEHCAKTPDEIQYLWNAADKTAIQESVKSWELHKAEEIMGIMEPYPNLDFHNIRSEADLAAYRRKAGKNAIHIALCSICLGLDATERLDRAQLRAIFSNAALTLAEIEGGCSSYDQIAREIMRHGLSVDQSEEDISLRAIQTDQSNAERRNS